MATCVQSTAARPSRHLSVADAAPLPLPFLRQPRLQTVRDVLTAYHALGRRLYSLHLQQQALLDRLWDACGGDPVNELLDTDLFQPFESQPSLYRWLDAVQATDLVSLDAEV